MCCCPCRRHCPTCGQRLPWNPAPWRYVPDPWYLPPVMCKTDSAIQQAQQVLCAR